MKSHTRAWLGGLAWGLVMVPWSDALGDNEAAAGIDQAHDRKAPEGRVDREGGQPGNNGQDNVNGQGGKNQRDPIMVEFQGLVAKEQLMRQRLKQLLLTLRPGHPHCRALEAQLDQLNKQKTELLRLHPFLLREFENAERRGEERNEIEAKLGALQARERALQRSLDETKKEQELLLKKLKKHPELPHR